jgi:hypothetical protein
MKDRFESKTEPTDFDRVLVFGWWVFVLDSALDLDTLVQHADSTPVTFREQSIVVDTDAWLLVANNWNSNTQRKEDCYFSKSR